MSLSIAQIAAARIAARRAGVAEQPKVNGFLNKLAHLESNIKDATSKYLDKRVELSHKRFEEGCRFATEFKAPVIPAPVATVEATEPSFVDLYQ